MTVMNEYVKLGYFACLETMDKILSTYPTLC